MEESAYRRRLVAGGTTTPVDRPDSNDDDESERNEEDHVHVVQQQPKAKNPKVLGGCKRVSGRARGPSPARSANQDDLEEASAFQALQSATRQKSRAAPAAGDGKGDEARETKLRGAALSLDL